MRLKLSSGSRKRPAGIETEYNPADVAMLNLTVDSQSLFRRRALGLWPSGENGATGAKLFPVFDASGIPHPDAGELHQD
jgi:hypothetical protein